tara:strand:+ start:674 stop:895 length:222 start_codon:yes stop_codon:yes gene_type:complete
MIGKTIYGYWGAGIEPSVAKITGYMETNGDTYFAARDENNKVYYLYGSEIKPGPVPSYGPIAELGGWYHEEVA